MVLPALIPMLVFLAYSTRLADWADVSTILAAAGTLVAAGGTLAAAWAAFKAIAEGRRFNAEKAQPYVVVSLESLEQLPGVVELVVRNLGQTAATGVRLEFEPAPMTTLGAGEDATRALPCPSRFSVLVPGQRWSTTWDSSHQYDAAELPREFKVAVTYSGLDGKEQPILHYVLDWSMYIDRGYVDVKTTADVVGAIHQVAQVVKKK